MRVDVCMPSCLSVVHRYDSPSQVCRCFCVKTWCKDINYSNNIILYIIIFKYWQHLIATLAIKYFAITCYQCVFIQFVHKQDAASTDQTLYDSGACAQACAIERCRGCLLCAWCDQLCADPDQWEEWICSEGIVGTSQCPVNKYIYIYINIIRHHFKTRAPPCDQF